MSKQKTDYKKLRDLGDKIAELGIDGHETINKRLKIYAERDLSKPHPYVSIELDGLVADIHSSQIRFEAEINSDTPNMSDVLRMLNAIDIDKIIRTVNPMLRPMMAESQERVKRQKKAKIADLKNQLKNLEA
jgi:hypothetical protein